MPNSPWESLLLPIRPILALFAWQSVPLMYDVARFIVQGLSVDLNDFQQCHF